MNSFTVGFFGMLLFGSGCVTSGDLSQTAGAVSAEADVQVPNNFLDHNAGCTVGETFNIVGTWAVTNQGSGTAGQVTFKTDGSYTIDSGTYNAGGTWSKSSSGTYKVLAGGAIGFLYTGWTFATPFSRIAVVQCAGKSQIVHFIMGHTHDYEVLTRMR
jgi:hypothetical protein